jgi:hypothetical protein
VQIGDDEVVVLALELLERLDAIGGRVDVVASMPSMSITSSVIMGSSSTSRMRARAGEAGDGLSALVIACSPAL